jgi:RNA polymerase sigma factor (sigma-70 family)
LNQDEFLEKVRENQGIIYKLVALYAVDAEEKKDLYQEVLFYAWKGWPGFRGESKFSTWLYRVSINTIFTHQRRHKKMVPGGRLEETLLPPVQHASVQQEDVLRLQQAIRKLPETDKVTISLHLDGYENAEIAEILGISTGHLAVKLHRAKQQLANLLKQ